jgi:hypothetical protein
VEGVEELVARDGNPLNVNVDRERTKRGEMLNRILGYYQEFKRFMSLV